MTFMYILKRLRPLFGTESTRNCKRRLFINVKSKVDFCFARFGYKDNT